MTQDTPKQPDSSSSNRPNSGADHLAAAARQAGLDEPIDDLRGRLGEELSEVELGECIGRGGMGAVFRARQRSLDRPVAVKVLLPPPGGVTGWGGRFRQEAQALARLQHPGIVTIHDYGESGDLAWLVMELVEGANLRVLLEDGRLTPSEALAIVPPICEALQYAHERGIVHRDIKPENVLIDTEGQVKLVDFGLAKLSVEGEGLNLTRSDQVMGTPRYMAPEQLERPLEVDHRADIFSLGIVLYEMLTGQVPAGVVEPPSRKASVDARLDEVVLRALQREPEHRHQSASDLEHEVKSASDAPEAREEPRPTTGEAGPVRVGFTWTDALALLTLPLSQFVFAFVAQMAAFEDGVMDRSGPSPLWSFLQLWFFVGVLWWGLPIVTVVHSILVRRRGRALPPAMPMVRTVWSLAWLLAALLVVESARDPLELEAWELGVLDAEAGFAMIMGLAAVALGAWNQKGTHRRLLGPTMETTLLRLTGGFAALATLIGITAFISGAIPVSVAGSVGSGGLAFAAQLPIIALGVVAAALARGDHRRTATFVLTIGVSLTLAAHVIGEIRYDSWSGAVLACLSAAVVTGFVTVAGTAMPQTAASPAAAAAPSGDARDS